nr:MAG TPA: ABC sugar transporter [Caudoviricetes sp.]
MPLHHTFHHHCHWIHSPFNSFNKLLTFSSRAFILSSPSSFLSS